MMTENELIKKASKGDTVAFEELITPYQLPLFRLALRMCNNEALAEDITQEALLSAWKGLPNFRGDSKFSSWLYRLTCNAVIDAQRREKRHQGQTDIDELQVSDGLDTPQEAVENSEKAAMIHNALGQLSQEHREIILLRHMQDLSYDEIGEVLNLPSGTVKSRLNRAKTELKEYLIKAGTFSHAIKSNHRKEECTHE